MPQQPKIAENFMSTAASLRKQALVANKAGQTDLSKVFILKADKLEQQAQSLMHMAS